MNGSAKHAFWGDADLFVLPSYSENVGLAAVEALAVGCPVVSSSGVNIARQVESYEAGWVASPEPKALASALAGALRDRESRLARGEAGRRLVAECYDGDAVARDMLKANEECLD